MSRVAVITGAASGMGLAVARRLASVGNWVALLDLDGDAATGAAEDLRNGGAVALAMKVDVTDRAAVDDAIGDAREELGPIEINLTGTFNCIQAAIPDMLAAGWGRIVTISSSSAQSGAARMAHYVASKGGVVGLTKALAVELAPHGITVNTIPPGFIDTPMARRAEARGDLPSIDAEAARTPVRRAGTPEDIAAACAFLCSDEAGYITGQLIGVNGGWYL